MHGRALDLGAGPYKVLPHFISVDDCRDTALFGIQMKPDIRTDVTDLSMFATQSFDCVFSSHTLEHIVDYKAALREWWRVVKPGGHLCLYLPHADFYPRRGQHGANPDHKHDFLPTNIIEAMKEIGGFDLVENEDRNETDEYSFWQVYKKTPSKRECLESWKNPKPAKTCAVVRYAAIGDAIISSSIYPWLKEQGYHVTLYCQAGAGYECLKNDPHIDRFIIQGKDEVPPQFLQEFWDYTRKKYDKWVNLCESVEGTLLACPGRVNHEWPNAVRAKYMDRNYLEFTHELAEVPPPYRPKFYSTLDERAWARKTAQHWGGRNILWSLSGSSVHKAWPHLDVTMEWILRTYPDVHIVLVGDQFSRILQAGWDKQDASGKWVDVHPRVHCKADVWNIRESMSFAEVADLIIGTETGLLNAAGSMEAWKIVTLSHSSKEMLTRHWRNVIALEQPKGIGCPKQPCRQLHYTWDHCMKHEETGTAVCQFEISPEMMWDAVQSVLGSEQRKVA